MGKGGSESKKAELEQGVLHALRALEGRAWQEVQGELQEGSDECAIWILLFEDSDPKDSHAQFCQIVAPTMEAMAPVTYTVTYSVLTEFLDVSVETFMDNQSILKALDDPAFGQHTMSRPRQSFSVFKAARSLNRP